MLAFRGRNMYFPSQSGFSIFELTRISSTVCVLQIHQHVSRDGRHFVDMVRLFPCQCFSGFLNLLISALTRKVSGLPNLVATKCMPGLHSVTWLPNKSPPAHASPPLPCQRWLTPPTPPHSSPTSGERGYRAPLLNSPAVSLSCCGPRRPALNAAHPPPSSIQATLLPTGLPSSFASHRLAELQVRDRK